jgi:ATP:ADP antiporter, AAA family
VTAVTAFLLFFCAFCAFALLLASATTFLYFEQLRLVTEAFPDANERIQEFARIDLTVQVLALATQAFFTGATARHAKG